MTEEATTTLNSLPKDVNVIVVKDEGNGANWARNNGFKDVKTEYVLFSDNDIEWEENALEWLLDALEENKEASYSYGMYEMGDNIYCDIPFDENILKLQNYISTMSLIRTKDFPGFDENIRRFQDWDLWLTMLEQGKKGIFINKLIFKTKVKEGITHNKEFSAYEAFLEIKKKHNL